MKTIQPSGGVTSMAYDADGLRLKKEDATGTKLFVWDDQNYLAETEQRALHKLRSRRSHRRMEA